MMPGVIFSGKNVWAADRTGTDESAFITKILSDRTVQIEKYIGNDKEVVIPEKISGKPVTAIGIEAFYESDITEISLPAGLTRIDQWAFGSCMGLKNLTIPEGVREINYKAFYGCTGLKSLVLPESVVNITEAFTDGNNLEKVFYYGSSGDFEKIEYIGTNWDIWKAAIFYHYNPADEERWATGQGTYGNVAITYLDKYDGANTSVTVPAVVEGVSPEWLGFVRPVFDETVKSVTIADGYTSISKYAFLNCTSLTEIMVPKSVTWVEDDAFSDCTALKDIWYAGSRQEWNDIRLSGSKIPAATEMHYLGEPESSGETYTVTFDAQGFSDVPVQTVKDGGLLTRPESPVREEYNFAGWYSGENLWDFDSDAVRQNQVLTARWEPKEQTNGLRGEYLYDTGSVAGLNYRLLAVGESVTIACGNGAYNFEYAAWSSTNAGVLTPVNARTEGKQNVVTAKAAGFAVVTIAIHASHHSSNMNTTDDVVTEKQYFHVVAPVTEIGMPATLTAEPGETVALPYTTTPAGNFSRAVSGFEITSSAPSVLEVDEWQGLMTAKKEGTAVLTAKVADGAVTTQSCTVTVKKGGTSPSADAAVLPGQGENSTSGVTPAAQNGTSADDAVLPEQGETSAGAAGTPETKDGEGTAKNPAEQESEKLKKTVIKKGDGITYASIDYTVTATGKNAAVTCIKAPKKSKITIPATIKDKNGTSYKVTAIAVNALKNNKKVTSVTVGNNVKTIGASAFSGCTKLKTVTLGTGVTTIGKAAFKGDGKLKTITIKSTKLKTVGSNVFKGIHAKAKIKVPKKKLADYKKKLKGKGQGKKVTIKKM